MPKVKPQKTGKDMRFNPMAGGMSLPVDKKHGQHMLKNPGIVDKIVAAADIKPSDVVFEIGPGTGNLTMRLLEQAKRVVAYEIDPRMAAEVRKRAMSAGRMNLEVKDGDVLRTPWPIFDKEFAERLIAKVGESQYGRLAVNTSLFVKVSCVCKVSRGSFNPPPEVDSMVVRMVPRDPPVEVDFREWDGLMRICFSRKRKILRSSFTMTPCLKTLEENYRTWCALTGSAPSKTPIKDVVVEVLNRLNLAEQRAIKIDIDTFFRLLLEFNKVGIHFSNAVGTSSGSEDLGKLAEGLFVDEEEMDED